MYRLLRRRLRPPRSLCDSGNADQDLGLSFEFVIGFNQFEDLLFDVSDLFFKEFGHLLDAAYDRLQADRVHSVCFSRHVIKKLLASDDQFLHMLRFFRCFSKWSWLNLKNRGVHPLLAVGLRSNKRLAPSGFLLHGTFP